MKLIFKLLSILLFVASSTLVAQKVDRSQIPQPGPAPEIKIGDAETFSLDNGLKVYVVENNKLPTLSVSLSFFRDPILEKEKSGMLSMFGQVMSAGTTSRTKEQLDEEVDFIGASLNATSTGMYGYSLTRHEDKLMELMTDVLYNPLFSEEELSKAQKQMISGLASEKDDPSSINGKIKDALLYGADHPYGEPVTEETIGNVSIDDLKAYYDTYFRPNIASLVLVGNINADKARSLAEKYFGDWEEGEVPSFEYEDPKPTDVTSVALMNRESSVQSVINIAHTIPYTTTSDDRIKVSVLNNIFGGSSSSRLFRNLREDKGYTYGAYSSFDASRLIGEFSAGASVRNAVTDSAITEFLYEMKRIREEEVSDEELNNAVASLTGSFARSLESPQTVANFALNIDRYNLPKDYYATYLQKLNAVSKDDILDVANKYIHPDKANIVVVGNAADIADGLAQFGEVRYYDADGNPTEAPKAAEAADLSADEVIARFIEAIGGESQVKAANDVQMVGTATVQEQPISVTMTYGQPGQFAMTMSSGGMTMTEQYINGDEAKMKQMGQELPVEGEQKEAMKREAYLVPEMYFAELGLSATVKGIKEVEGTRAYEIEISDGENSFSHFYDAESFLRIRKVSTQKTPQGEMSITQEYKNWEEVQGLMYPTVLTQDLGMMKLEFNFEDIKVGSGANSIFE